MNLSNTHKLVTIPSDTLLDPHRDDDKRDVLLNLHSLGNPSDIIWIGVSSESKVRAMRSGRMFSLELPLSKLLAGDTVSV